MNTSSLTGDSRVGDFCIVLLFVNCLERFCELSSILDFDLDLDLDLDDLCERIEVRFDILPVLEHINI